MKKKLIPLLMISFVSVGCGGPAIPTNVSFTIEKFSTADIHTQMQLDVFINNITNVINDTSYQYLEPYNTQLNKNDLTLPNPVHFKWTAEATGGSPGAFTVSISESSDMSNALTYKTSDSEIDIYNFKTATKYYWTVSSYSFTSEIQEFKTSDVVLRGVKIDGVNNVRDVGGYFNKIKQGMLYRGGAFEKYNSNTKKVEINVTTEGVDTIKQLGIKTEVDLRRNDPEENENCGLTESSVSGLRYVGLPMQYHNENILTYKNGAYGAYDNPARIKEFFELLAVEDNYPVYVHCSQGKDRTGCLSYLVEALLGVEKDDLLTDYLFSSLSAYKNRVNRSGVYGSGRYGTTLTEYATEGQSFQETVYNYLHNVVEISTTTLDSVINILSVK